MYLYKIREVGMAIRDYIICRECKCKLLYDGEQNGREWLEERWGKPEEAAWTIEGLLCPPCDMKQQARIAELEAEKMQIARHDSAQVLANDRLLLAIEELKAENARLREALNDNWCYEKSELRALLGGGE